MTTRIFLNARLFTGSDLSEGRGTAPSAFVVKDSKILHVGVETDDAVVAAKQSGAECVDLNHRIVTPGFVDGHVHLLFFGLSLLKLDLGECKSLSDIRKTIAEYAKAHPELPRILCRGWYQATTNGNALATDLDDLDERPIFIEALDLHSTWCNTAALRELPMDQMMAHCPEFITVDGDGNPTGLISEIGVTAFIWPFLLSQCTPAQIQAALDAAFSTYAEAGYTGIIDMAMDKLQWNALIEYRKNNGIPIHVAAHWFVPYLEDPEQQEALLQEAREMHELWHPDKCREFCVVGIKLIADGTVDGCTAALDNCYGGKTTLVHPMWPRDSMMKTVKAAADAGMQCAIHAIGDVAITQAIDSIEAAQDPQGRHRIEHLEVATKEDAARLGRIGITASVQPFHCDPAIMVAYEKFVGPDKWKRVFAYQEFLDGEAHLALGTDAPTAPYRMLHNLYVATTRKSAMEPGHPGQTPGPTLKMVDAVTAATQGAAYSRFAESWTGALKPGLRADFVVLDAAWEPTKLLEAKVWQTWAGGSNIYKA